MDKVKSFFRNVVCSICNTKLYSVYARKGTKFFSVEGYYWCSTCKKIFCVKKENGIQERV